MRVTGGWSRWIETLLFIRQLHCPVHMVVKESFITNIATHKSVMHLLIPERAVRKTRPPVPLANLLNCSRFLLSGIYRGAETAVWSVMHPNLLKQAVGRAEITAYLVGRQHERESHPETGAVQQQSWAQMSRQPVLTDAGNVVRFGFLLQTALHHIPSQQTLNMCIRYYIMIFITQHSLNGLKLMTVHVYYNFSHWAAQLLISPPPLNLLLNSCCFIF